MKRTRASCCNSSDRLEMCVRWNCVIGISVRSITSNSGASIVAPLPTCTCTMPALPEIMLATCDHRRRAQKKAAGPSSSSTTSHAHVPLGGASSNQPMAGIRTRASDAMRASSSNDGTDDRESLTAISPTPTTSWMSAMSSMTDVVRSGVGTRYAPECMWAVRPSMLSALTHTIRAQTGAGREGHVSQTPAA